MLLILIVLSSVSHNSSVHKPAAADVGRTKARIKSLNNRSLKVVSVRVIGDLDKIVNVVGKMREVREICVKYSLDIRKTSKSDF